MTNLVSNPDCGPSNALSTFSKQSQQDRTLQQDRWVPGSSRTPVNTFPPAPSSLILQESLRTPELHRGPEQVALQRDAQQFFQQARSFPGIAHDTFQRNQLPPLHQPEEDWHRQFQKVNISTPPPQFLSQNQLDKQPDRFISSQWHDEYARFQTPSTPFSFQPQVQHRLASVYTTSLPYEQTSQSPSIVPQFEDEAFELAFAEAENAVHVAEIEPEIEEQPKLSEKEEADRLAKTAGELFDRLQHERETNEKFRNSSFMALMKKLRDREVVVEGNKMVDSMSLHAGETNTIEDSERI